jgi:hypothetical protein
VLRTLSLAVLLVTALAGCDQINDAMNKQKANGQAVGAGCRLSGRSLEDCYRRNPKISKPDIFSGWKDMNEYMQAKKLEVIAPRPEGISEESGDAVSDSSSSAPASQVSAASAVTPAKAKH